MNEIKLPARPDPDGFLTIRVIGHDVEVNAYRDSTMEAFARAAVTADRAQRGPANVWIAESALEQERARGYREGRASLQARIDSLEAALHEWIDKTAWVQQTCQPKELGMHRADILKARIAELEAKLAEAQKGK